MSISKQAEKKTTVDSSSAHPSENESSDDDDGLLQDELTRKNVQILSARLYDLRERFMKIVQKINNDAKDYEASTSDEGKHFEISVANPKLFFFSFIS